MTALGVEVREKTDALDSAGNTTAAIGKGFAIGSAALVGMALFGAFITRTVNTPNLEYPLCSKAIQVTDPLIFSGLKWICVCQKLKKD
jgi:inorganic pyrophosphatase